MGRPIEVTRQDYTATELRAKASRTRDGRLVRRLLAVAMVLDGRSRQEAASANGLDRQILRDWILRYNADGVDGLADRQSPGRPTSLTAEQMAELKALVVDGPDVDKDGVVRWRCIDLQAVINERFSVTMHVSTVGKVLRKLGLTWLQPRPYHPQKVAEAEAAFKRNFSDLVCELVADRLCGKPLEIWFQDEARVGQQGTLTYLWAPLGSRPVVPKDCRREWAYLFGAVCPDRAVGAALVMPTVNIEAMNKHLEVISRSVTHGAHAALLVDGAGWHRLGGDLQVPDNITLVHLPPYSPELNSMENVWEYLRANKLSLRVWETYEAIVDACSNAWNFFINDLDRVRSVTTRDWAKVNL